MKKTLVPALRAGAALAANAGALESLENFIRTAKTGHAE